jgi:serine/threonine protein kinase
MIETLLNHRYLITELLGEGAFGKTYLAKDRDSHNCLCVIKQLDPKQADIETAKKLFQREAEVLKSLKKEQQIPKFFEYFEQNQQYYLVEEYINKDIVACINNNISDASCSRESRIYCPSISKRQIASSNLNFSCIS